MFYNFILVLGLSVFYFMVLLILIALVNFAEIKQYVMAYLAKTN
jgi:hypothetical protein